MSGQEEDDEGEEKKKRLKDRGAGSHLEGRTVNNDRIDNFLGPR
jgi:hypothetical protein